MKLHIIAISRMKSGPERDLFDDYAGRFRKAGPQLGFRDLIEIELDSGGGLDAEGERLLGRCPHGARLIRLDEGGRQVKSAAFAGDLAAWRDDGVSDLAFLIGGAAGFSKAVRAAAPQAIAFGPQTWPHKFVRAMLAEQIYRASAILSGSPYHKA